MTYTQKRNRLSGNQKRTRNAGRGVGNLAARIVDGEAARRYNRWHVAPRNERHGAPTDYTYKEVRPCQCSACV